MTGSGFTAQSTAAEVAGGIDLTGRRAVVTGAASGIGLETARALAGAGAEVTLAVRDTAAGERAAAQVAAGGGRVLVAPLDLADQRSVAAFAAAWHGPLDVLVNNAGVMMTPQTRTPEGWELQFATNHLGHFALTTRLRPALAAAGRARVVSLSSVAHLRSPVHFDDLHFRVRPYDAGLAYAQSKTANVLFAVEASRRWAADGVTVNAVHPGAVLGTNLSRHLTREALDAAAASGGHTFKTPQQGAATVVFVATAPRLECVGGRYFEDCAEAHRHIPGTSGGVADHALDPDAAALLWQVSLEALAADVRG